LRRDVTGGFLRMYLQYVHLLVYILYSLVHVYVISVRSLLFLVYTKYH